MINIAKSTIPTLSGIFGARSGMQISQSLLQKKDVSQEEKELFSDQKRWGISTALGLVSTVAVALSPISLLSLSGIGAAFTGGAALGAMSEAAMNFIALKKIKKKSIFKTMKKIHHHPPHLEEQQTDKKPTQHKQPKKESKLSPSNQNMHDIPHLKPEENGGNTTSPSSTSEPPHPTDTPKSSPSQSSTHNSSDVAPKHVATGNLPDRCFSEKTLSGHGFNFKRNWFSIMPRKGVEGFVLKGKLTRQGKSTVEKSIIKIPHSTSEKVESDEIKIVETLKKEGLREHDNIAYVYGSAQRNGKTGIVIKKYKKIVISKKEIRPQKKHKHISQCDKKFHTALIKGVASATHDMLEKRIRHNDLHIHNIMYEPIEDNFKAKIIDFGTMTQCSEEDNELFGLMDYKFKHEFLKKYHAKLSRKNDHPSIEEKLYTSALYSDRIQDANIMNNPINTMLKICKCFKSLHGETLFDNQNSIERKCIDIMKQEKHLYKIHATLIYLQEKNEIKLQQQCLLPDDINFFVIYGDIEGLKRKAKEIAGKIRAKAKELFKDIAEAPDTLTAA